MICPINILGATLGESSGRRKRDGGRRGMGGEVHQKSMDFKQWVSHYLSQGDRQLAPPNLKLYHMKYYNISLSHSIIRLNDGNVLTNDLQPQINVGDH